MRYAPGMSEAFGRGDAQPVSPNTTPLAVGGPEWHGARVRHPAEPRHQGHDAVEVKSRPTVALGTGQEPAIRRTPVGTRNQRKREADDGRRKSQTHLRGTGGVLH